MIVSYCLNPSCSQPKNKPNLRHCQNCGWDLILHNRYRAIKKIGKGGFGNTFLGMDLSLPGNPLCVIKQLRPSTNDPDAFEMALELFEREAKTLGKIDHPQIPRLLDYFEAHHHFYLVQSLVKGKTLQQEVKENGVFSEIATKRFLVEILPVIQYIHSIRMIHRDIKPANIIRREQDGQLVLIDFGAVKDQVNSQIIKNYGQTVFTQFAVGTVGFAPPEQLLMRPVYASDIYALGVTCLYLMTGKPPKDLPCDEITGELHWQDILKVAPNFARVLRKMLEADVRYRYKSAEEVMEALDIAPYEQELKEGLFTNLETPPLQPSETSEDDLLTSHISATTRLAMAIRARKSRQGKMKFIKQPTSQTLVHSYELGRTDFSEQSFINLHIPNANLRKVNFRRSKLIAANLQEANLEEANFYDANLSYAKLNKANLQQAYFVKTNLQNADLEGANLQGADFTNANLSGTNLSGADLTNAKVEEQQLEAAKTNWGTIYPEGKRRLW